MGYYLPLKLLKIKMNYFNYFKEKINFLIILVFVLSALILYSIYLYNETLRLENSKIELTKTLDKLKQNSIAISNEIQQKESSLEDLSKNLNNNKKAVIEAQSLVIQESLPSKTQASKFMNQLIDHASAKNLLISNFDSQTSSVNLIETGIKIPAIDYSLTGTGDINAIIGLLDLIYQEKLVNIEQIEISKNQTIDLSLWEIKLLLKIIHF
mgnify:CR=1 FL=1